jgi:hypothetical protein
LQMLQVQCCEMRPPSFVAPEAPCRAGERIAIQGVPQDAVQPVAAEHVRLSGCLILPATALAP